MRSAVWGTGYPVRVSSSATEQTYTLLGADGQPFESKTPARFGGNRRAQIYGRLDCPSALRARRAGGYASHRVFFADQKTAVALGFRPCAICMKDEYGAWKAARRAHS